MHYVSVRRFAFSLSVFVVLSFALGCSSGSTGASTTPAPANLVYPQTTVAIIVGQAVSANTPSVTGTVTLYSISPALPAGLTLNTSTGTISGTPTAAIPSTTFTITASNSTGSTSTTVQITVNVVPPTGLSYSPSTISAIVGTAITTVTPTVTGAVSSYSVTPALPAGISLNPTTGAISGTPTAAVAQATYVVTATNVSGSTTASLQIVVVPAVAAPSSLNYPKASVSATAGQPIIPDIPSFNGTVTSFTVAPALPTGLSLDSTNGTIYGTPTGVVAQSSYTVTAANSGGSTTAAITLAVNKAYTVALDLGHANDITSIHSVAGRLLSQDAGGHWVLWDSGSNSKIADGNQDFPASSGGGLYWPIDMAGSVVAVGLSNGVEVRSSSDGHLISLITAPTTIDPATTSGTNAWWKLATDGSYICAGSAAGLAAWTPNGQQIMQRQGDYSKAKVFAVAGQIQIALGAAGNNVIETIPVNGGMPVVSPAFSGTFASWFLDGQRFLTNTGSTYWTYSAAGAQQAIVSLPPYGSVIGQGNWLFYYNYGSLQIYAVGSGSPAFSTPSGAFLNVSNPSGTAIEYDNGITGSIVDVSTSNPVKYDFSLPPVIGGVSPLTFAAIDASKWYLGYRGGLLVPGSNAGVSASLDLGPATTIAGGTARAAVATANGAITFLNPAQSTSNGTINFLSSSIAVSSDDTLLAAIAPDENYPLTDHPLNLYSLPSGSLIRTLPNQGGTGSERIAFSMSASGALVGQSYKANQYVATVGPNDGTVSFTALSFDTPLFSPNGTLTSIGYNIYNNGVLANAISGQPIGWLDNNRLLVVNYQVISGGTGTPIYKNTTIVDIAGTVLATAPIPQISTFQTLGADQIYVPSTNSIYSVNTGQIIWTSTTRSTLGAVAGQYVIFASGARVLIDTH